MKFFDSSLCYVIISFVNKPNRKSVNLPREKTFLLAEAGADRRPTMQFGIGDSPGWANSSHGGGGDSLGPLNSHINSSDIFAFVYFEHI